MDDVFSDDDDCLPVQTPLIDLEMMEKRYRHVIKRLRSRHENEISSMKDMLLEQLNQEREAHKYIQKSTADRAKVLFQNMQKHYEGVITRHKQCHFKVQEEIRFEMTKASSSKISLSDHKASLLELNMVHQVAQETLKQALEKNHLEAISKLQQEHQQEVQEIHRVCEKKVFKNGEKVYGIEASLKQLKVELKSKIEDNLKAKEQLSTERQVRIGFESKLKEACKHILSLKEVNQKAERVVKQMKNKMAQNKEKKSKLKQELTAKTLALMQASGDQDLLEMEIKNYKNTVDTNKNCMKEYQDELHGLKQQIELQKQLVHDKEVVAEDLGKNNTDHEDEIQELREELEDKQKELIQLREERHNELTQMANDGTVNPWRKKCHLLETELKAKKKELRQCRKDLDECRKLLTSSPSFKNTPPDELQIAHHLFNS